MSKGSELLTDIGTSKLPGNSSVLRIAVSLQGRDAQAQSGQTFKVILFPVKKSFLLIGNFPQGNPSRRPLQRKRILPCEDITIKSVDAVP